MKAPTLASVRKALRAAGDPNDASFQQRYFKTGKGEYGEGDRFLGIRVPVVRRFAREFRALSLSDTETLLHEPWHEARLLALLLLVDRYERGDAAERNAIYALYLKNTAHINNWDLVDSSAPSIVGAHLATRSRARLDRLARSRSVWERRIAVIATLCFIGRNEFDDTLRIAALLLNDDHDLIHKAVGWMLREVGKRDAGKLETFLDEHSRQMPRTMLRYAVERMPPPRRRHYMAG